LAIKQDLRYIIAIDDFSPSSPESEPHMATLTLPEFATGPARRTG
jgi:hypothetical protein